MCASSTPSARCRWSCRCIANSSAERSPAFCVTPVWTATSSDACSNDRNLVGNGWENSFPTNPPGSRYQPRTGAAFSCVWKPGGQSQGFGRSVMHVTRARQPSGGLVGLCDRQTSQHDRRDYVDARERARHPGARRTGRRSSDGTRSAQGLCRPLMSTTPTRRYLAGQAAQHDLGGVVLAAPVRVPPAAVVTGRGRVDASVACFADEIDGFVCEHDFDVQTAADRFGVAG